MAGFQSLSVNEKDLQSFGIDSMRIRRLYEHIESHTSEGFYPGAAIALARNGVLLAKRCFGSARIQSNERHIQANDETLWLLYSQTKPLTSCAIWILAERGVIGFHEPVSLYLKNFELNGKDGVTIYHLLTHQAGFPNAEVPERAWNDRDLLLDCVCKFNLEWLPGSRVFYHASSAHWVQAAVIEAVTGMDYRKFIEAEVLKPLGMNDTFMGVPERFHHRVCGIYERTEDGEHVHCPRFSTNQFIRAGAPSGGGFSTASDMAMFYQALLGLGSLNGKRILSPATVRYVTRNHTGDRIDEFFGIAMNRGLGVHVRGDGIAIRGLGSMASPSTYGHGGVGTSYSWADPATGVSFTYLTNSRLSEPAHSLRLDRIATMAQSAVVE